MTEPPSYKISYRVMVFMPHETSGKDRKLALPYHGPYRIMNMHSNCVSVKPVDKPDDEPILVELFLAQQKSLILHGLVMAKLTSVHINIHPPLLLRQGLLTTIMLLDLKLLCSTRTSYSLRGRNCKTVLYAHT